MITAEGQRAQIGQVMVDAGLLTEEQLEHALAEQQRLGRPLGEVIVGLGLASAGAVANALAEQSGGPLQTEHGFALGLGLRTHVERVVSVPEVDDEADLLRRRVEELQTALMNAQDQVRAAGSLRAELARTAGERDEAVVARDEALRQLAERSNEFVSRLVSVADEAQVRVSQLTRERDDLAARLAHVLLPRAGDAT